MGKTTGIEWTDATWNPIRGCSRVSEGCRNCYAEVVANRFSGPGKPYEGLVQLGADGKGNGKWNGQIQFVEKHLLDPLRWKKPQRIFVNSMSDLFHEGVTDEMLDRIFAVMALCPQHTFQVLTKRPERMLAYCSSDEVMGRILRFTAQVLDGLPKSGIKVRHCDDGLTGFRLPNVWLGTSIEGDSVRERSSILRRVPAAVRFLSCEPLIQPLLHLNLEGIHWVIVGGESGPGARPMHPEWARSLRDQCVAAKVPFFFKQWGEWFGYSGCWKDTSVAAETGFGVMWPTHTWPETYEAPFAGKLPLEFVESVRCGKKLAGRLLDGREWNEMPGAAHG